MSYIHGRFDAREGRIVRLYMRFYQNGVLVDPISFGNIIITPENSQNQVMAIFSGPVRYELGTYYVEWNVPSTDINNPNYSTLFNEIVNNQLERNFRDTWNNIKIGNQTFNQQGNFYVRGDSVVEGFDAANLLQFTFSLKNPTIAKGSKDYLVMQLAELDNKLVPGGEGWPEGQMAIRKDRRMIKNFSSAQHQSNSNLYALYVDTDGFTTGTYESQLKFEIEENSIESQAVIIGTRSLPSGYQPLSGTVQKLALDIDGQIAEILFESNATRAYVTGAGVTWGILAKVEGQAVLDNINVLDTQWLRLLIDDITFDVTFSGTGLLISEIVNQINAASILNLGYGCCESFIEEVIPGVYETKLRIYSNHRASHTSNDSLYTSHVKIVASSNAAAILTGTGFNIGQEGYGSDLEIPFTGGDVNNHLLIRVDPLNSGLDFKDVTLPFGYWTPQQIVDFLNGNSSFSQASIIASNSTTDVTSETYAVVNKTITIESNAVAGGIINVSHTFYDPDIPITGILTLNQIISQLITAFSALNITISAIPITYGGPPNPKYFLEIKSNVVGASSYISVIDGTALSDLGFVLDQTAQGGDQIYGAYAELLGDNRIRFIGETSGSDSKLQIASTSQGSSANELLGFTESGVSEVSGSDAGSANVTGYNGVQESFPGGTIVSSTSASLTSYIQPILGWNVGGQKLNLQIDNTSFIVQFIETLIKASITGSVTLLSVNFVEDHKFYFSSTGTLPAENRKYADIGWFPIENDAVGSYFEASPGFNSIYSAYLMPTISYQPCHFFMDPSTVIGTWGTLSTITGAVSGTTAVLRRILFSTVYDQWLMAGANPGAIFKAFRAGAVLGEAVTSSSGGTGNIAAGDVDDVMNWHYAAMQLTSSLADVSRPYAAASVLVGSLGGSAVVEYDYYTGPGSNDWITLRSMAVDFQTGETIVGAPVTQTVGKVIPSSNRFTLLSTEMVDNNLIVNFNGGVDRTVNFATASNPWSLAQIVTKINSTIWSFGDQARADTSGVNLVLASDISGPSSQVALQSTCFGSGANTQLGLPPNPVHFGLLDSTIDPDLRVATFTTVALQQVWNARQGIGGAQLTGSISGALGDIIDVFYYQSDVAATKYYIVFRWDNTSPAFGLEACTVGGLGVGTITGWLTRVDLSVPASYPTVGNPIKELCWYDDTLIPPPYPTKLVGGFVSSFDSVTGDLGVSIYADIPPSSTPGAVLIDDISGIWYPVSSIDTYSSTSTGSIQLLTSYDIASQINAQALLSGLTYNPASVTALNEIKITSQEFGTNSKIIIWQTVVTTDNCQSEFGFYDNMSHIFASSGYISGLNDWATSRNIFCSVSTANYVLVNSIGSAGSSFVKFAVSGINTDGTNPWPMDEELWEDAAPPPGAHDGEIQANRWGYGSIGIDGNDIFSVIIDNTIVQDARLSTSLTTYSALGSSLMSQMSGIRAGSAGTTPNQLEVETTSNGSGSLLRIMGGDEGSFAPEYFGWGSTRLYINDAGAGLLSSPEILIMPYTDLTWSAYVMDIENDFRIVISKPSYAPSGGSTLTSLVGNDVINLNSNPMLAAARWNFATILASDALASNVTFETGRDSLQIFTSNNQEINIRFAPSVDTTYTATEVKEHLNAPRVGIIHGSWPGAWPGSGPTWTDGMLITQPVSGAAGIIDGWEGIGTLRLKELSPGVKIPIRLFDISGAPIGAFNVGDYVRWYVGGIIIPANVRYGWVTYITGIGAANGRMVVLSDPDNTSVSPTLGDGTITAINTVQTATIEAAVTDAGIMFMTGYPCNGYQRDFDDDFGTLVFNTIDVTHVPNEFIVTDSAGKLIFTDKMYAGIAQNTLAKKYFGSLRISDTSATTAWFDLGFPAEKAGIGLYARIGGGYIDSSILFGPNAKGTDASPPIITASIPLTTSWIQSLTNSIFEVRMDADIGSFKQVIINNATTPVYHTLWDIIDLINGVGIAKAHNITYPVQFIAGHSQLYLRIDNAADVTINFNTSPTSYTLDDIVAKINAEFVSQLVTSPPNWPVNQRPYAYNWNGQLLIVSGRKGSTYPSSIKVYSQTEGSTINGWLGFPSQGILSTAVGNPQIYDGINLLGLVYPSDNLADSGQLTISSLLIQTETNDSAVEINSSTSGSTANSTLGFSSSGIGPVFGQIGDATYTLTGDNSIVTMINAAFGGYVVADTAGNSLRLTSLNSGTTGYIEVLSSTSWDVQMKFGLLPQKIYGNTLVTTQQLIASPWIPFQVI